MDHKVIEKIAKVIRAAEAVAPDVHLDRILVGTTPYDIVWGYQNGGWEGWTPIEELADQFPDGPHGPLVRQARS